MRKCLSRTRLVNEVKFLRSLVRSVKEGALKRGRYTGWIDLLNNAICKFEFNFMHSRLRREGDESETLFRSN